jgi:hypothetical protein
MLSRFLSKRHGAAVLALLLASCSDNAAERLRVAQLSQGCTLNSSCEDPLVCTFERCHEECEEDRDCPDDQRCVLAKDGNVCQLPIETGCDGDDKACKGDQVCGADGECRDPCGGGAGECVSGQICATSKECASSDPVKDLIDAEGNIQPQERPDAGMPKDAGKTDAGRTAKPAAEGCAELDTAQEMPDCEGTETSEVEPNETKAQATPICFGNEVSGVIDISGDKDSYSITAPPAPYGGVLIVTWTATTQAIYLAVRNSVEGRQLATGTALADGSANLWIATAPDATYILDVSGGASSYMLSTEWSGVRDCYEPNDERDDAKRVEVGQSITAKLHAAPLDTGDQLPADWYSVALEAGEVTFDFKSSPEDSYIYLNVYDPGEVQVSTAYSRSPGATLVHMYEVKVAGDYLVEVTTSGLTTSGSTLTPPKHTIEPYELTITQR